MNGATLIRNNVHYMSRQYFVETPEIPEIDGGAVVVLYIGHDPAMESEWGWTRTNMSSPLANSFRGTRTQQREDYYRFIHDCAIREPNTELCDLIGRLAIAAANGKTVVIIGDSHMVSVEAQVLAEATTWVRDITVAA